MKLPIEASSAFQMLRWLAEDGAKKPHDIVKYMMRRQHSSAYARDLIRDYIASGLLTRMPGLVGLSDRARKLMGLQIAETPAPRGFGFRPMSQDTIKKMRELANLRGHTEPQSFKTLSSNVPELAWLH